MSDLERVKINGDRHYKIGDDAYPSVTVITGLHPPKRDGIQGFKQKYPDTWKQRRDRAGLLGTLAHHRILNPLAVRNLPVPEVDFSLVDDELETDIETCEALWDDLAFDVGPSPYVEERLVSHKHEYAGTADLITTGPENEAATVVDLKTTGAIHDSYRMQVAAYRVACCEMPSMPNPDHGAIIRLDPDPETNPELTPQVEFLRPSDLNGWFKTFLELREKYQP